ncbi:MAG: hypothetical protein JWQ42_5102 [Edaphobacter sp.]|nr:hypothetical protein [Edaphobacter sp.]
MFGLFKSKMTVDDLANVFAAGTFKVMRPSSAPKVEQLVRELIAAGADSEAVHLELGAFTAFTTWAGAALALQKRKISETHFSLFHRAFGHQLSKTVSGSGIDGECMLHRGSMFSQFLDDRMQTLITISTETEGPQVLSAIVDAECEWLGRPWSCIA